MEESLLGLYRKTFDNLLNYRKTKDFLIKF